jgi:DNA processing protein
MALEQGREVMAVPGGVVSGCHRGCHALIKDGAHLVETAADVLTVLKWQAAPPLPAAGPSAGVIGGMLPGEAVGLDELVERMSRPAVAVLAELGQLEVAGQVARMPGGLFVRLD